MKMLAAMLTTVLAFGSVAQRPIDDLPPDVQDLLRDPWQRAIWDLAGVDQVVDEMSLPPGIDEEWAATDPEILPQSWEECARLLDLNRPTLDELSVHASELTSAYDLHEDLRYRHLARIARIDALHAASQRDLERAARRIATIFDIGRAKMTDGSTTDALEGFAVLTLATSVLKDELSRQNRWLTEQHLGPVRDAFARLAERRMRWPLRPRLDEKRAELAASLEALFRRLGVDHGVALEPDPALASVWRGTWVGTARTLMLEDEVQDFVDEALRAEIRITFLPIEGDPTRAKLVIRTDLIAEDDLGLAMMAMAREREPGERAERLTLRCVDSAVRGWVVDVDEIRSEMREQFQGLALEEGEAMLDRFFFAAGQPTEDRFEISMFDPVLDVLHSTRMRLTGDGTMKYETVTMTEQPWSGSTATRQWATLRRAD